MSILSAIAENIFQPGVNVQVVAFVNVVFVACLILFLLLGLLWDLNIHVIVLGSLTLILIILLNWFIAELQKAKMESNEEKKED